MRGLGGGGAVGAASVELERSILVSWMTGSKGSKGSKESKVDDGTVEQLTIWSAGATMRVFLNAYEVVGLEHFAIKKWRESWPATS